MNTSLLLTINGWAGKHHFLDTLMVFFAKDLVYILFATVAICMGYLLYKRQWRPVAYFAATLVVSFIFLQIAAHIYVDNRPFVDHHLVQLVAHAPGKSFPSDHTTVATAIAMGTLLFTRFKKIGWLFLGGAVVIGFARIFCGIHYPVDIAGGLLTGITGGFAVFGIQKSIAAWQQRNAGQYRSASPPTTPTSGRL